MESKSSSKIYQFISCSSACALLFVGSAFASPVTNIQEQRSLYDRAQKLLDKRQIKQYQSMRSKIAQYPLTPYTDYRAFLINLASKTPKQVNQFIEDNYSYPFSVLVRAPYLESLAYRGQWRRLLEFQTNEPKGEQYQCYYYTAKLKVGDKKEAYDGMSKLWLSGDSISKQCDKLINAWDRAGFKTDDVILKRMLLAFEERNTGLMSYLKRQLKSSQAKEKAAEMERLYRRPENVARFAREHSDGSEFYQVQIITALQRLARKNVEKAQVAFSQVMAKNYFHDSDKQKIAEFIAIRLMNTDSKPLIQWRDDVVEMSIDDKLIERRTRLAIQHNDWLDTQKWIAHLSQDAQDSLRWQYWLGRSEIALGAYHQGKARLSKLLGKRNFYSVAAAGFIGVPVAYPTTSLNLDHSVLEPHKKALYRIQELIDRTKLSSAKSEWNWLLRHADIEEKKMLAAYAADKNWHHLTVTASISARLWDNVQLRFPIAHQWWFDHYAEKHGIDPITLMSLARQESALDVNARSPVGARGIMQIMPRTAQYTARKYRIPYKGARDLYSVGKNIEIGSSYLNGLLERFNNNRILAFAAYNAGPHRVKQWRERSNENLDVYAFIESIPFSETRGYVQNILMFETYYRDLMGVDGQFLTKKEKLAKY
ncbi:transglycosylase SLT domain-containing protein [Vibrio sp. S4M6]|uniref:transglycosylase SLT domain-containing protein n=1 Tax=Vibrio sinus TaxID=2946865 RepID=UPI00202A1D80|nr:transglycosylase SLT domain-containing protein [Vibrio sinus]MCL9781365.1 transglycosylase SLT domain-containing protein [Vibrio sinus]